MPELEDRLRATLSAAADEVPPSIHPRAELDRRLAARGRSRVRGPIVAAAAAAVVIAGVAVPVALNQGPDRGGLNSATSQDGGGLAPATSWDRPTSSAPPVTADYLEPPHPITSAGEGAELRHLGLALDRDGQLCFLVLDADERPLGGPVCEPLPTWSRDHVVTSRSLAELATRLPMPPVLEAAVADQLVFITAPEVVRLDVLSADGAHVNPTGGWWPQLYWSLADFDGPSDGFSYAAYDIDNKLLEQGIT